ncbi:hypothetical protein H1R20_g5928, partial [Candolleomyces eurysporus]
MSNETAPQQPVSTDENPEWYSYCCSELSKTITVGFVNPTPGTPVQQAKVQEVVKEWEKHANLKFRFIPNGNDAEIRISFQLLNGSWSYIGNIALQIAKPNPTMNYGWVHPTPGITEEERGVILHEFGHAIGYLHEHQSPRRGEKLTLNEPVVIEYYKRTQNPPWEEAKTRANVINVYSRGEVSNFSATDFTSIMMYYMPANFNLQGITIRPNRSLSALDKAYAFLNYPFLRGAASVDPNVTLVNALNAAGVTGTARTNIAAEYTEGDWRGLRAEFTRWTLNQRAALASAPAEAEAEAAAEA